MATRLLGKLRKGWRKLSKKGPGRSWMDCGGREAAWQDSCGQGGVEQTEKIA